MNVDDIDSGELQSCMVLAMDFIVAYRVGEDHRYDLAKITAARDLLEDRVLMTLIETNLAEMPNGWSWKNAAREMSMLVAVAIVEDERAGL